MAYLKNKTDSISTDFTDLNEKYKIQIDQENINLKINSPRIDILSSGLHIIDYDSTFSELEIQFRNNGNRNAVNFDMKYVVIYFDDFNSYPLFSKYYFEVHKNFTVVLYDIANKPHVITIGDIYNYEKFKNNDFKEKFTIGTLGIYVFLNIDYKDIICRKMRLKNPSILE